MHCFLLFVELFNEKNPPSLSKSHPQTTNERGVSSLPHLTSSALSRNSGNTHSKYQALISQMAKLFHTKTIQWLTFSCVCFLLCGTWNAYGHFSKLFGGDYLIKQFGRHFHSVYKFRTERFIKSDFLPRFGISCQWLQGSVILGDFNFDLKKNQILDWAALFLVQRFFGRRFMEEFDFENISEMAMPMYLLSGIPGAMYYAYYYTKNCGQVWILTIVMSFYGSYLKMHWLFLVGTGAGIVWRGGGFLGISQRDVPDFEGGIPAAAADARIKTNDDCGVFGTASWIDLSLHEVGWRGFKGMFYFPFVAFVLAWSIYGRSVDWLIWWLNANVLWDCLNQLIDWLIDWFDGFSLGAFLSWSSIFFGLQPRKRWFVFC